MNRDEIKKIFETFFEKYKKTEGDRTVWSAFWSDINSKAALELNMTKCSRGTVFKIFVDNKKISESVGWDEFYTELDKLKKESPELYEEDRIFSEMKDAI